MSRSLILIVAHDYPPIYSPGTERIIKFAQYLPEFGFQPLILTTNRYGRETLDRQQGVYRASDWVHTLFSPLRRYKTRGIEPNAQFRVATLSNQSLLGRLRDHIMIPDTKLGWFWPAVRLGYQLLRQHQPVLIFSSSPPETAHLIAQRLHAVSRLPWVADLRDGWLFEPPNPRLRRPSVRRKLEGRLEQQMILNASALTTATPPIAKDLCRRYPQVASKVTTITNGYDRAEFLELSRQRPPDGRFLLTHTGALASSREGTSAGPFFAAVAKLVQQNPDTPLRVQFIGSIKPEEQAMIRAFGLEDTVSLLPPVSHRAAYQYQLDADALLLITALGQQSVATLKLFDYIGAGLPILALAQDNVAADIVNQYGLGIAVAPDNPDAIARALDDLMTQQRAGKSWPGFAIAQRRFDRRDLTEQLAQVFESILH
jgi:glycosyltransferase involved in cell wall biosynthesis